MPIARSNGIDIAYEVCGPVDGPPMLLVHGLGAQLIRWPVAFYTAFADAGFRVIRCDNRDVGLSTHMHGQAVPDPGAIMAAKARGEVPATPYTLSDMAADAGGLLDALGVQSAHVLGVSLGGMIAQVLAIEHPQRVRSLAIMMSHSGNPALPSSDPTVLAVLSGTSPDPRIDHEAYLVHSVTLNRALGSPEYPADEAELRNFAAAAGARAYDPAGAARQFAASRAGADRRAGLRQLDVPTLVIHGAEDRLIPAVCGEDIARNVKRAWLLIVNGMGHDLPASLLQLFHATIMANMARVPMIEVEPTAP